MTDTTSGAPNPAPHGYSDHKADQLSRLHKVEGQVRGITRMVADDRYCVDVLTQIGAVTHALQEVALGLLDDHVRHCVRDAVLSNPAGGDAKLDEVALALRRALRL